MSLTRWVHYLTDPDAATLRERAGRLAAGTYPTLTSETGILS
jgi:hypothetical protein